MIPIDWVKDVKDPDKKKLHEDNLRASQTMISSLLRILSEWEQDIDTQEVRLTEYDNAAWAYKQAHRNGERSRIRKVRDLLVPLQSR